MAGISASLHIMIAHTDHLRTQVDYDRACTVAVLHADDGHLMISGPPDRIAATLRELANKVDASDRDEGEGR
jgi:hypothetical protein